MARTILYRGQHRRFGEKVRMGDGKPLPSVWCYGGIFPADGDFSIIYGKAVQAPNDFTTVTGITDEDDRFSLKKWVVHTNTVSQYVGFDDANGKQMFEDDIVRVTTPLARFDAAVVAWDAEHARWGFDSLSGNRYPLEPEFHYEVLGNVFDNPDMFHA